MSKTIIHYNIDNIDKEGANFNLIWGEKSNGKSYQVKHKKAINMYEEGGINYISSYLNKDEVVERILNKGSRFILMRRFQDELTSQWIESYFSNVDIENITDGEYNGIKVYRKEIFYSFYDFDTRKERRGPKIGYAIALSEEQKYAGAVLEDVDDIIYEEFMSRTFYLHNEPNKLMTFYSTVDRKKGTTKLWMVGNTTTRINPYVNEWGLSKILFSLKQGEIKSLWLKTGEKDNEGRDVEVKLAIEHCKSTGSTNYVIGTHAASTNKGEWETDPQPKLPKKYEEYKILYKIGFEYKATRFIADLLQDKESKDVIWFIRPHTKEFKDKIIIFSDIIKTSKYYQRDIYNISIKNDRIQRILSTFRENSIFYASDLCGTEFKQSIDFIIRK